MKRKWICTFVMIIGFFCRHLFGSFCAVLAKAIISSLETADELKVKVALILIGVASKLWWVIILVALHCVRHSM